jgi:pseudaminic acid cytidylyltransferase
VKIAVIPARGGSKRIPRKNIRLLAGKPIMAYSIEAAVESRLFDKIIVSTDDAEIASVAKAFGAEVPFFRPHNLADDFIGTSAVVKHAIEWFLEQGQQIDYACCIYATAPFLRAEYLKEGFDRLAISDKKFSLSVTSYAFPIQRAIYIGPDGVIGAFNPEHIFSRSQDLQGAYHDAAQFCWGRSSAFLDEVTVLSSACIPIVLPRYLVQDIDTEEDWGRAELMLAALKLQRTL